MENIFAIIYINKTAITPTTGDREMSNLTFKASTCGLLMNHDNLKRPHLVRVEFYINDDGDEVTLKSVNGRTLSTIKAVPFVKISREEYADRPCDQYDDTAEALWALRLMGRS